MSYQPLHVFDRAGLYLTVFLIGAAVMVIELLGTRMITPFYGVSLTVWSSLISVTMIALAMGYFAGGQWADRAKRTTGLSLIISLAALWVTGPVLLATDPLGLRAGAFVSALVPRGDRFGSAPFFVNFQRFEGEDASDTRRTCDPCISSIGWIMYTDVIAS